MTMRERFEGEDLEPQVQEAMREIRRQEFKASRAPWRRQDFGNADIAIPQSAPYVINFAGSGNTTLVRCKRIQVKLMVPKSSTNYHGYLGFLRIPEGMSISQSRVNWDDPAVLRPVLWMTNPDHATYWDAYLPALNLADGGNAYVVAQMTTSGTLSGCSILGRLIEERSI